jgi:hypothetical protein
LDLPFIVDRDIGPCHVLDFANFTLPLSARLLQGHGLLEFKCEKTALLVTDGDPSATLVDHTADLLGFAAILFDRLGEVLKLCVVKFDTLRLGHDTVRLFVSLVWLEITFEKRSCALDVTYWAQPVHFLD